MADLGNITALKAAIDALLNNGVPDESIEPNDHNALLDDLLDTITGLSKVLRAEGETGGYNLTITAGDLLRLADSGFFGDIDTATLTADRTYTFQDASGVVAFLSDVPAALTDTDDLPQGATNLYNQTHTGDVTGATALSIQPIAITGQSAAAALTGTETILAEQSGGLVQTTTQDIADLGGVTDGDKGDITVSSGGTVWSLDNTVITSKPSATVAGGDLMLISDIDDSNNLKQVTAQSIADLASNIYTTDGTLSGARTVTMGGNDLTFDGGSIIFRNSGVGQSVFGYTTNGGYLQLNNAAGSSVVIKLGSGDDYINTGNNFGIGTATPTTKVDIRSSAANDALILRKVAASQVALGYTTNGGYLQLNNAAGSSVVIKLGSGDDYINTGNNFGIGLTAPTAKLHVKGSGATAGTSALLVENNDTVPLTLLEVKNDGTLHIGADSPSTATTIYTERAANNAIRTKTTAAGTRAEVTAHNDEATGRASLIKWGTTVNGYAGGNASLFTETNDLFIGAAGGKVMFTNSWLPTAATEVYANITSTGLSFGSQDNAASLGVIDAQGSTASHVGSSVKNNNSAGYARLIARSSTNIVAEVISFGSTYTQTYLQNKTMLQAQGSGGIVFNEATGPSKYYFNNGGTTVTAGTIGVNIINGKLGIGITDTEGSAKLHVQGNDALLATKAFFIEDNVGTDLFDVRNDGSIFVGGSQGFSGTGAYTNFTIVNGIITAAS